MVQRSELVQLCNQLLQPQLFKDYCPNGLQVEGRSEVKKIVSGVTASRALIEAAIAEGADTLLVHHGLFWRGQDGSVSGWMKQRLALLLAHDINLLAGCANQRRDRPGLYANSAGTQVGPRAGGCYSRCDPVHQANCLVHGRCSILV